MIPDSLRKPPTVSVRPDEVRKLDDLLRGIPSPSGPGGSIQVTFTKRELDLTRTVLATFLWMTQLLSLPKAGVGIIRKILNISLPPKTPPQSTEGEGRMDGDGPGPIPPGGGEEGAQGEDQVAQEENQDSPPAHSDEPSEPSKGRPNPNHPGRRTSEDLKEAEVVDHFHKDLLDRSPCPRPGCRGRVYQFLREGKVREVITFDFSPPFRATVHRMHDLRCNFCFRVYKASLPPELVQDGASKERYLYPAQAALVLFHYGMGMAMYRLDQIQALTGERFPESTQFDILEKVGNVFKNFNEAATRAAADAFLFQGDDVGNRVLEMVPEIRERRSDGQLTYREGIHTSILIATTAEGYLIPVLKTGINHFGELLDQVLRQRSPGLPIPQVVCDGSKVNQSSTINPIMGGCWQHAQEYFYKARKNFPAETEEIKEWFKKIFEFDRDTHKMGAFERLEHLKEWGLPFVEKIKKEVEDLFESRTVLPKSEMGQAMGYFLAQYDKLLLPFTHPGIPLTNNLSEWCTYLIVRYLANSKFYMSRAGAAIGDTLMMVILFSYLNHLNPHQFLLHGLRHQGEIKKNPGAFFPWNLKGEVGPLPSHKQMHFWAPAPPPNQSG